MQVLMSRTKIRPRRRRPPHSRTMTKRGSQPTSLLTATLLASMLAGCRTADLAPVHDRLRKLEGSSRRICHDQFAPTTAADRLANMARTAGRMKRRMTDKHTALALSELRGREIERLSVMQEDLQRFAGSPSTDLAALQSSPGLRILDPSRAMSRLQNIFSDAPRVLAPTGRPLREHDDREHRTRIDDDHPEASWLRRLLRRLFP